MDTPTKQPAQDKEQSPEQEGQFDTDGRDILVAQGTILAYKAAKSIQGKASVEVIGRGLFEIIKKVETDGKKHGVSFGLPVVASAAPEILAHIIKASGTDVNEEQQKAAIGVATGLYLQDAIKSGKMTQEDLTKLVQQYQGESNQGNQQAPQQQAQPGILGGGQ
jgi:hypothetical protein